MASCGTAAAVDVSDHFPVVADLHAESRVDRRVTVPAGRSTNGSCCVWWSFGPGLLANRPKATGS